MFFCFSELQREKTWSRIHLVPLLLAEGDRDAYRRQQAALAREKEIMKDVQGWEVGDHELYQETVLLLLFFSCTCIPSMLFGPRTSAALWRCYRCGAQQKL